MKKRYQIEKYTILFAIGGMAYFLLEVLVRGYSHYSMFLCGGACFLCCGLLNENVKIKISFISQMVLSSVIITVLELITGFIVNVWLKMDIWDYSHLPYNFKCSRQLVVLPLSVGNFISVYCTRYFGFLFQV